MFERFTDTARHVVVQAQADARRLGHNYIGCEHLLLAAAASAEPASAVLRDQGVTPERIEAAFGPDALTGAFPAACRSRRPAWGKGPLAELTRRRRARRGAPLPAGPRGNAPLLPGPAPGGHIPFTPRAKKSLELSLREAKALHDNYIGVQHLTLALLALKDGMVPMILSALGAPATPLRAAILACYRKAS